MRRFQPHRAYLGGEFPFDPRYLELAVVVGDRIRRLRHDRGLRLMDIARSVPKPGGTHYSGSYFSRLERGWAHAPLYVYCLTARALEVDQWELFAADDVRHDPRPGERVLLRVLRQMRVSPEEALARIAGGGPAARSPGAPAGDGAAARTPGAPAGGGAAARTPGAPAARLSP